MIIRGSEIEPKTIEKPRDGRGNMVSLPYEVLNGIEGKIKFFSIVNLESDSMVGYHEHTNDMEIYLMLDGTAVVSDNGAEDILKPGDMLITKKGESHFIENKSATPVTFMAIIIE
jgi:mannose-6-phosphate isomerase-like protein (cupin superfamily)